MFPWRDANPYQLAVAEILLQKTRAASAVPVYNCLINAYGAPQALVDVDISIIRTIVRPLGLSNKRAAQLKSMAEGLVSKGHSILSDWRSAHNAIPGLGTYGARAVASFGFGKRVGVVDANVARIIRRVFRVRASDNRAAIFQHYADALAAAAGDPRAVNYGLLDLGGEVCVRIPQCSRCPIRPECSYAKNLTTFDG